MTNELAWYQVNAPTFSKQRKDSFSHRLADFHSLARLTVFVDAIAEKQRITLSRHADRHVRVHLSVSQYVKCLPACMTVMRRVFVRV